MNDPQPDCDQLLRRCQRGDDAALTELVHAWQERIFRLACRVLTDTALAEDAAGQTFVKIWNRAGQWHGESSATTWIYRLAVRTILDVQRSQQRWWQRWTRGSLDHAAAKYRPDPDDRVALALRQLNEADRALVHLYYFEERGLADLEAILNVPRANLKMRLARARERLRKVLEQNDDR